MGVSVDIEKKLNSFRLDVHFEESRNRIGILGASGCGKSMTLKSIAGVVTPDKGRIRVGGRVLFDTETAGKRCNLRPQERRIGYLFQNYALFPTMTVEENIGAGLKGSKEARRQRVAEMVGRFRLKGLEKQLPASLSGGQQQRTALARLMAYEPDMILLDEPFSAMDSNLRDQLQQQMTELLKEYEGTVILVSHNRDEIYRFCSSLLIMEEGRIVAHGDTKEVFRDPQTKKAARMTGCKNFTDVKRTDAHSAFLTDWGVELHTQREIPEGTVCMGYRAHEFIPVWTGTAGAEGHGGDSFRSGERGNKQSGASPAAPDLKDVPLNSFRVEVTGTAELPFERNFYLEPQGQRQDGNPRRICWYAQEPLWPELDKKGLPQYLQLREKDMLFLRE